MQYFGAVLTPCCGKYKAPTDNPWPQGGYRIECDCGRVYQVVFGPNGWKLKKEVKNE